MGNKRVIYTGHQEEETNFDATYLRIVKRYHFKEGVKKKNQEEEYSEDSQVATTTSQN